MVITFINREKELKALEEIYKKENSFVVIYGRRRIGKTELIKKFIRNKNFIYFFCEKGYKSNLLNLEQIIKEKYGLEVKLDNYKTFFNLIKKLEKRKIIIVFDEFQYLAENEKVLNEFQYIIDEIIRNSNIHFIILSSSMSFMKKLLQYKSPLYGRRDLSIKLTYLSFFDSLKFFELNSKNFEEIIKIFGITGGVPLYLKLFKEFEDIKKVVFSKYGFLYQEIEFLLSSEFREYINYKLILEAIAKGKNTFNEISNFTGIQKTNLFIYLENLMNVELIEKEIPITESYKTKRSRYVIKDNYVLFYFKFVEKYKDLIEFDNLSFYHKFLEEYNSHLGLIFEKIAKEFVLKKLYNKFNKIGRWWWKDKEIDLLALNEKNKSLFAFEIKWRKLNLAEVKNIIKELEDKVAIINWNKGNRKEFLGIIAKKMDEKAKEWLKENRYLAYELKDFEKYS